MDPDGTEPVNAGLVVKFLACETNQLSPKVVCSKNSQIERAMLESRMRMGSDPDTLFRAFNSSYHAWKHVA